MTTVNYKHFAEVIGTDKGSELRQALGLRTIRILVDVDPDGEVVARCEGSAEAIAQLLRGGA